MPGGCFVRCCPFLDDVALQTLRGVVVGMQFPFGSCQAAEPPLLDFRLRRKVGKI